MTEQPSVEAHRQRVVLVTGLSGAGKTTALRVLEDLGWEAIDNFPIRLLDRFVGAEGHVALRSALSSCAPGILTVNIDNGFGGAMAALRILRGPDTQGE